MAAKKVLIIEDDATLSHALAGTVKKAGYESVICAHPSEALEALDHDSFKVAFIDCLLPQIPGIDLAKSIRKSYDSKILPIVMMSGIFTDKQLMRDMAQEVTAIDFLKKPFEVTEVLKFLEQQSATTHDDVLARSFFSLPDRIGANPLHLKFILQDIQRIHGFEFPILFTTLIGNSYSGFLLAVSEKGEKTKVSFSHGSVVAVESSDVQSYIGKLFVANGWVIPDDLESVLEVPSDKKLGERLIEENLISPHSVFEVIEEQMVLRLTRLISDQNYVLSFQDVEILNNGPSIDPDEFYLVLDDWVRTSISEDWLNHQMTAWLEYGVHFGPSHDPHRQEYSAKSMKGIKNLISAIQKNGNLSTLYELYQGQLGEFNQAFYYMLCFRFILFSEKHGQMSTEERTIRLQKIWHPMKALNLVEVFLRMGGRKDMGPNEIKTVYNEFKLRHLGILPQNGAPAELVKLYEMIETKITEAYELFLDPHKLSNFEREIESGKAFHRSEAQLKAEEAKKFLSMRQFSNAQISLAKALELYPKLDHMGLYQIWVKVGLMMQAKSKVKDFSEVDQLMAKISGEEKISAVGNFVQGLVAKAKGEIAVARKLFESALIIDKSLIDARRELNSIAVENKKPLDLLHGDLGQVIGKFFKKN